MSSLDLAIHASTADVANDNRPLSDQEMQVVRRLLSDPFSFPLEFKTWLVSYLETSDLTLSMSAVMGLKSLLGVSGAGTGTLGILPAGIVFPYGGATAPTGSLLCDGTGYSRTTYSRLFAAIGTTYGAPDGTSFNVPDLRERIPVGRGVRAEHDTLGDHEGLPVGSRGTVHNHSGSSSAAPDHTHTQARDAVSLTPGGTGYSVEGGTFVDGAQTGPAGAHSHTINVGPGGSRPNEGPAFITLNFIIVS